MELTRDQMLAARARIGRYIFKTPVVRSQGLGAWLKLETQQPTGAFKIRPAFSSMLSNLEKARACGVLASSSGNFAQAVAYAARELGVAATIVMTSNASAYKIARARALGAEVVLSGPSFDERMELTRKLLESSGKLLLSSYDTPETIAGDATLGLELLEQLEGAFTVIVPASGGGLLAGVASAVKAARPGARVIGVQSAANGSMLRSFQQGRRVRTGPFTSLADALVATIPGEVTFPIIRRLVDDVVVVDEDEIRSAVQWLATEQKLVVEPGAATSVAALRSAKVDRAGQVICVLSGGNIDPALLARLLVEETQERSSYRASRLTQIA